MSLFLYQVKQACISLKQKPGFIFSVVSTMGITLGALLCVLTLAYVMLVKPLPYPEQERLFLVESTVVDKEGKQVFSAFNYRSLVNLYTEETSFESAALLAYGKNILVSQPSQPQVSTTYVTPELFELLDIHMAVGRSFGLEEQLNTYNPVAIISYDTWKNEFAGSTNILDEKLVVDNISFHIIGVVAQSFAEPKTYAIKHPLTDVWFPWDFNYISTERRKSSGSMSLDTMFLGRIVQELSSSQVEKIITPIVNLGWKDMVVDIPYFSPMNIKMKLTPLKNILIGDSENLIFVLIAGVLGLLMIATTNIANLFMSRAAEQQAQYSIHAALGASKSKLFKVMLTESALLMLLSLMVAIVVASLGFYILSTHLLQLLPRVNELTFSYYSFCVTGLLFVGFTWIFTKLASTVIDYKALTSQLQSGSKGGSQQVSQTKRNALIISQISIAMLLVFININLFVDAWKVINEPLNINIDNTIHAEMSLAPTVILSDDEKIQINKNIRSALQLLPQVEIVSLANGSVFSGGQGFRELRVKGSESTYPGSSRIVDENYFQLYQLELLTGDFFDKSDISDNNNVVIINEAFAKEIAPSGSAIGIVLEFFGEHTHTVKGVVKDFKLPDKLERENRLYFPGLSEASSLVIKLREHNKLSRQEFVSLIQTVTSEYRVQIFESDLKQQKKMLFIPYTILITTGLLTLLTFALTAIGLYGVLSYSTQMRRFEIGTRLAIGAKRHDLIKLIIQDNARSILMGISVSLLLFSLLFYGFNEIFISYVSWQLLPVFVFTLAVISTISFIACYLPLRQYINQPAIHSLKGSE
ncbi:MAG: ABC transporter permease [Colwellia sp.]|nr:ABC transporter permease [Colwellia sp.]